MASEDFGTTGRSSSTDMHSEWRSGEQVENGAPSTSPPLYYYDSEYEDDGPKPHELYGKHTWTIEKFQSSKTRELRGEVFDVGGYKWYILIYPKGCDVHNHLSLFLCVANHEKLLPGWSHLAQFSISVVNKDPKKSKYSDTMHRFWKKEHDWGWKKFMELSKVKDGFLDDDENLVIKAEVQVIRERTNRPFRCLDYNYRRELVRVYLSNVEQSCRDFFEKIRGKFNNLMEDKSQWSSFQAFWVGIDRLSRRRLSKEHSNTVLKQIVKHFFVEKEVTSTLVMDSLYTGFKALEYQSLCADEIRAKEKLMGPGTDPMPDPLVIIEDEVFMLNDDLVSSLECAVSGPFLYKDDRVVQNGKKEDSYRDSIESQEWRMAELGRRTMEVFVLDHIFTKIEDSYKEAVALQMQEELIREEELNGNATNDLRGKNTNKDNKRSSKKKQAKQKKNNRKENKGKGKDFTLDGKIVENSNESDSNFTKKPEISGDLDNNSSDNSKPLQPDPIETIETETPKGNNNSSTEETKFQDFNNNINRRRLSRKGNNNRRNNNNGNNSSSNNNNNKDLVSNHSTGTSSPCGETPTHSGRYYSGNYRRTSESDNLVVNLKDRIRHLQQRLVEVEDSLLKQCNAKELSEVFPKTETESASASSSSSSPMKNPTKPSSNSRSNPITTQIPKQTLEEIPKQTLVKTSQTLEIPKQTLEVPQQIIEITPKTMEDASQTQEKTLETLKSAETLKPVTKDPVPVPVPVPTNTTPSKPKPENQKPKQIITKEKSTNNSTNTNANANTNTGTGTGTGTATNTSDICTNFIKVGPRLKTKPKSSLAFSVSQPSPPVSVSPTKPPVILSHSNLTVPSNHAVSSSPTKPPVILSHSNVTVPPNHGLRFGTFNVEPPKNPSNIIEPLDFPDELKNTFTYLSPIKCRVSEEQLAITKEQKQREIASAKMIQEEEFPFIDIINDLLEEDQYGLGFNQSFFSRQLPRHERSLSRADVSASSRNYRAEDHYEMIRRSYESYDRRQAEISSPFSDGQMEVLRNRNAYISMAGTNVVPAGNVGSLNGYSPYRYGDYSYSADVVNVGFQNDWYNLYCRMNGANDNLGPLHS
ncbi:hypothetical protein LUZ60_010189 [Juncus effusus]|nr:hypothetical protein LUZ60_010189 [Juncus effusus]